MPLNPNTSQENSQLISLALRNSGGQSMNPYLCSGISQFGHDRLGPILIQYIKKKFTVRIEDAIGYKNPRQQVKAIFYS